MPSFIGQNITQVIDAQTPITGSIAANGTLFTTDTTGYNSISVQITGAWESSIVFQVSNDNTNFVNVQGYAFNSSMSSIDTVVDNDIYLFPVIGRYFRAVVFNYVAGTVSYTTYLRSQSLAGIGEALMSQTLDDETGVQTTMRFPGFVGSGIQPAVNAFPVALAKEQYQDTIIGGKGYASSVLTANILNNPDSQQSSIDVSAFHSIALQINSGVGSTPNLVFEGSNDNANFTAVFLQTSNTLTTTIPVSGITLAASTTYWFQGSIPYRYLRIRISTAGGTGTVACYASLSSVPYSASDSGFNLNAINGAAVSATTAQLGMNVVQVGASATVTGGASGLLAVGGPTNDGVASTSYGVKVGGLDATGLFRSLRTDPNGALTVANGTLNALAGAESETYAPLLVQTSRTTNGQESIQDLLHQILLELRIFNMQLKETPTVLATAITNGVAGTGPVIGQLDDPQQYYNDANFGRISF